MRNAKIYSLRKTAIILGSSILAAAWLIAGTEILTNIGIVGKFNELLVWTPAMILYFGAIAFNKQTLACEVRAFKRLIGRYPRN